MLREEFFSNICLHNEVLETEFIMAQFLPACLLNDLQKHEKGKKEKSMEMDTSWTSHIP